MSTFGSIEDIRDHLSTAQNQYYSDFKLEEVILDYMYDCGRNLVQNLYENFNYIENISFAGRSGGWIEFDYNVDNYWDEDMTYAELLEHLKMWKADLKQINKIKDYIMDAHTNLNKFIGSSEYCSDVVSNLLPDANLK